mmetsp:Transcript_12181/g.23208  ORF Transcript_12181/g.23208 Transcript_12181/m.23208 type:complete len:257 (-) Transcript_12181:313-1083(-)
MDNSQRGRWHRGKRAPRSWKDGESCDPIATSPTPIPPLRIANWMCWRSRRFRSRWRRTRRTTVHGPSGHANAPSYARSSPRDALYLPFAKHHRSRLPRSRTCCPIPRCVRWPFPPQGLARWGILPLRRGSRRVRGIGMRTSLQSEPGTVRDQQHCWSWSRHFGVVGCRRGRRSIRGMQPGPRIRVHPHHRHHRRCYQPRNPFDHHRTLPPIWTKDDTPPSIRKWNHSFSNKRARSWNIPPRGNGTMSFSRLPIASR